jgi:uncharacterized protein (TIGR02217 family)
MIEIRFPISVSKGASGGDFFDERISILPSGHEQRVKKRALALGRWTISFNNRDKTLFQQLRNFFLAMGGQHHAFRVQDAQDYESDSEQSCSPATGNGAITAFQLQKTYTIASPATAYVRTIDKPVSGTVRMFVNGTEALSGWTVNTTTGIVTFSVAPTAGHTVKATYEFDKIGRFAENGRESSIDAHNIYTWDQITIIEVPA